MRPAHRRWHRRVWVGLVFLLPLTFILAASTRARRPVPDAVPRELGPTLDESELPDRFNISIEADGTHRLSVRGERLDAADPLLYWTADAVGADWEPESGTYIGGLPFSGSAEFSLPLPARAGGQLVGYDLATRRVLFVEALPGGRP